MHPDNAAVNPAQPPAPETPPVPPEPVWAKDLADYLKEVETYGKETPRSQCFTRLMETLPFVPHTFISEYNRGMEASLSGEKHGKVVRGEADALFGSVIVEWEKKLPAKAEGTNAKLIEAKGQLCQYAAMLWGQENRHARTRYIGMNLKLSDKRSLRCNGGRHRNTDNKARCGLQL